MRSELEDVPVGLTQKLKPGAGRSEGITLARDELDQRRLAAAVRPQDGDVLTLRDTQVDRIQREIIAPLYGDIPQFEKWGVQN